MPSERDYQQARERRAWIAEEEERQRIREDCEQYEAYVKQLKESNGNCAPVERVEPVSFAEWRKHIPEELRDAVPAVRGATATSTLFMRKLAEIAVVRLKTAELTDEELQTLGFDPEDRLFIPEAQVSKPAVKDIFTRFADREPRYMRELHYEPIIDFLSRNKLVPSERHVALAFNHLLGIKVLPMPEPEPERPTNLNEHGVNLQIEIDPAIEARKRRERYEREVVVVDPETGKGWTEYMLDHQADSELYRRLMRIPRICKNPALEPQH